MKALDLSNLFIGSENKVKKVIKAITVYYLKSDDFGFMNNILELITDNYYYYCFDLSQRS